MFCPSGICFGLEIFRLGKDDERQHEVIRDDVMKSEAT